MELSALQKIVNGFTQEKGMNTKIEIRMIDIASEVGELSKEVLKGTNYGEKEFAPTQGWEEELGDVLFSLICIANETNTNLEDSLMTVLDKHEKPLAARGIWVLKNTGLLFITP
ncbi:MazG nucleotide pyrophosphohydrolase domain-containing protein [Natronincola ferrireducens]|uniref:NTP pyrophosphatase, house-cleaning of non-canonical NTPs n=1 Tax=Natronincola ferrireducens TaxID=393762 RepID=A0A1G9H0Q4_9FIRM|nr:MazG nucleotide pyrophosphohydrolase domain-containing protein [Natronincola ferrireducens]SDL06123.1 NTP pyrophosphatase, house-cleaning of non-canonical NTPs [Natronincola ferrireducens]